MGSVGPVGLRNATPFLAMYIMSAGCHHRSQTIYACNRDSTRSSATTIRVVLYNFRKWFATTLSLKWPGVVGCAHFGYAVDFHDVAAEAIAVVPDVGPVAYASQRVVDCSASEASQVLAGDDIWS